MDLQNLNVVELDELFEIKLNRVQEVDDLHANLDSINEQILKLQTTEELECDIWEITSAIAKIEEENFERIT